MEDINVKEVVEEIKSAGEDELKKVIEDWFSSTRTAGMKIGAQYISAGVYGIIKKHLGKKAKASLRDYERMTNDIVALISVQLETTQNDYNEENTNDGTTEEIGGTSSNDNQE